MKVRLDFVTNSSSSSYVCKICGNEQSGWDMGISDAGMLECENGHIFCKSHLEEEYSTVKLGLRYLKNYIKENEENDKEDLIEEYKEILEKYESEEDPSIIEDFLQENDIICDLEYEFPPELCPICSFDILLESDIVEFLKKKGVLNIDELKSHIKDKFPSYSDFKEYIEKKV